VFVASRCRSVICGTVADVAAVCWLPTVLVVSVVIRVVCVGALQVSPTPRQPADGYPARVPQRTERVACVRDSSPPLRCTAVSVLTS
jgi:hypothetical protein